MPSKPLPLGKYQINLESISKSKIRRAQITRRLNYPGTCLVQIEMRAEDGESLSLAAIPKDLSVEILDRPVFKGRLVAVHSGSYDTLDLIYADVLSEVGRAFPNTFIKDSSLNDCLKKLTSEFSLPTQFIGSFSETLPSFHFSGKSVLHQLQELGAANGFYFSYLPGKESLAFIKAGSVVETKAVKAEDFDSYELKQSGQNYFKKIALEYFDSQSMAAKSSSLSSDAVYSGVAAWMSGSSFEAKKNWGAGSVETPLADEKHFKEGESWLKGRLSRQLLEQDRLRVSTHHYFPNPGDKLTLSQTRLPKIQDGDYFVESVAFYLDAAAPRSEFTAIRA